MKNLSKKNLRVLLLVAICVTLVTCLGSTYAFFVYRGNGSNVSVEAGDINVKFTNDNNYLTTANSYPISDKTGKVLPYYSDFSINATTTDIGIKYEIQVVPDDNNSIDPQYIRLYLTDQNDNRIAGVKTYSNLKEAEYNENANLVYTGYITETSTKDFRLRMWIDESYNLQDGQTFGFKIYLYAVNEKLNYMAKINTSLSAFWPTNIEEQKANITSVNFVTMDKTEMTTRYSAATIKADVTDTTKSDAGSVLAWLETDKDDATKYIMYVASDETIFFPSNSGYMFYKFTNLVNISYEKISTSGVTRMDYMFRDCSSLTSLDVSGFDTGGATSMSDMFYNCSSLTSLDVGGFDTGGATSMSDMFYNCSSLTSLDVGGFDTGGATSMSYMFYDCSSLTSLDVGGFDTSNVTDMGAMFCGCSNLTSLDVSGFDTGGVTNMSQMFRGCSNLTSLDVSGFDTGGATSMYYMFSGCSNLTSLDVSGFDTGGVTNMSYMFSGCSNLTSLDVSGFDTGGVTNMSNMFYNCSSLTSLDVSGFDTGGVTNMSSMFSRCSNLTTIYSNTDWNTGNVASSSNMFWACTKLVGAISYDAQKWDVTYANPTTGYFTTKETA